MGWHVLYKQKPHPLNASCLFIAERDVLAHTILTETHRYIHIG